MYRWNKLKRLGAVKYGPKGKPYINNKILDRETGYVDSIKQLNEKYEKFGS